MAALREERREAEDRAVATGPRQRRADDPIYREGSVVRCGAREGREGLVERPRAGRRRVTLADVDGCPCPDGRAFSWVSDEPLERRVPLVGRVGEQTVVPVPDGPHEVAPPACDRRDADQSRLNVLQAALRVREWIVTLEWREVDIDCGEDRRQRTPRLKRNTIDLAGETVESLIEIDVPHSDETDSRVFLEDAQERISRFP